MDEIENTGIQVCASVIERGGKQGVSDGALEEGGLLWLNCIPAELTGRQGGPPTTYLYCTRVRRPQKKGKAIYLKSRLKTKKGEAKEPNLDEPPPLPLKLV